MKLSDIAKQLGSQGGKKSVESRFKGKTKEEISEIMRKTRLTKKEVKEVNTMVEGMVKNLNQNVSTHRQKSSKNQPSPAPSE